MIESVFSWRHHSHAPATSKSEKIPTIHPEFFVVAILASGDGRAG